MGTESPGTEDRTSLPWAAIPKFTPGVTDVTEYSKKLSFLASIWPKEHLAALAPRAALNCEGTAFKKVSRLDASKLKASDTSGVELLVKTLGGSWGQTVLETKYENFERAIYGTIQKNDETNDSCLARSDVCFEELLAQGTSFEELRAYVLLRQSQLSGEDKKKIIVEHKGKLSYEQVGASIRLLGSRLFGELQGNKAGNRTKVYDAFQAEDDSSDKAEGSTERALTATSAFDEAEAELDPEFVDVLAAAEDPDAIYVSSFETDLEELFQETPEMQTALVSYLEARGRLKEKQRNRGFWPVKGGGRKGGKGFSKGRGKGKRDREALLQRISRSHCRICGRRGHWKAECPDAPKETPAGVAATFAADGDDEVQSEPPEAAVLISEELVLCTAEMGLPRKTTFQQSEQIRSRFSEFVRRRLNPKAPKSAEIPNPSRSPTQSLPCRMRTTSKIHVSDRSPVGLVPGIVAPGSIQDAFASITEDGRIEAIVDTGASRCVLGREFLGRFLKQLHPGDRKMVKEMPSAVRFRFGNNQTLTSEKKLYLPVGAPNQKTRWLVIEVVPGKTPLLFSKRAMKQLGGKLDLENDTCFLRKINLQLSMHTNPSGLYLIDLASLGPQARTLCEHDPRGGASTLLASLHGEPSDSCLQNPVSQERNPSKNSQPEVSAGPGALVNDCIPGVVVNKIHNLDPKPLIRPLISNLPDVSDSSCTQQVCGRPFDPCQHGSVQHSGQCYSAAAGNRSCAHVHACKPSPDPVPDARARSRSQPPAGRSFPDATRDATPECSHQSTSRASESKLKGSQCGIGISAFHNRPVIQEHWLSRSREAINCRRFHGETKCLSNRDLLNRRSSDLCPDRETQPGSGDRPRSGRLGPGSCQLGQQAYRTDVPPCGDHGLSVLHMDESARAQLGKGDSPGLFHEVLQDHEGEGPSVDSSQAHREASVIHEASAESLQSLQSCLSALTLDVTIPEVDNCKAEQSTNPDGALPETFPKGWNFPLISPNNKLGVDVATPKFRHYLRDRFRRRNRRLFVSARQTDQSAETLLSLSHPEVGDLLLEVFAYPQSNLTQKTLDSGHKASRFTQEDGDLATISGQEALWERIRTRKPYHVFVAPNCGSWGAWSHFNISRSPKTALKIRQERERQRKILKLCSDLCEYQASRGRHFSMEHPQSSLAWKQSELLPMLRLTKPVDFEMCAFNLKLPKSSDLIRQSTTLRSTSLELLISLRNKRCKGLHRHQRIQGSVRVNDQFSIAMSKWTASYCPQFAGYLSKVLSSGPHRRVYDIESQVFPAEDIKPNHPPLTRKRFKTAVGHFRSVAHLPASGRKRASGEEEPASQSARARRPRKTPEEDHPQQILISPNGPNIASPHLVSDENRATWQAVVSAVRANLPTRGTARVPEGSDGFKRIREALPRIQVKAAYVTKQTNRLQSPMTAPTKAVAPFRVSIASLQSSGELIHVATHHRDQFQTPRREQSCPQASMLITLYVAAESEPPPGQSLSPNRNAAVAAEGGAACEAGNAPGPAASSGAHNDPSISGAGSPNLEGWAPPPTPLHGPHFRALSPAEKQELRKLHHNLGHPEPLRLAAQLQARGASAHVIAGAKDFVCDACVESTQVRHQRPAKLKDPVDFGDTVGLDGFFWTGKQGFQVYVVHLIDEGTLFHLGRRTSTRHLTEAIKVIQDAWASWAGMPRHMYLDPAGEFRADQILNFLQQNNTSHFMTAEAWQRGRIERHGDILKNMLTRMDSEKAIESLEEFDEVLLQCFRAKNCMVRQNGYSPEQAVLGKATHLPASLTSDESTGAHTLADSEGTEADVFRRHLERRCQARQAFLSADNDAALRQATLRRACPTRGPYAPNQWVLYWLKKSSPNRLGAGKWHGPAKVIAVEGQSIIWVSHGTRVLRCPPEYLRPASLREWQGSGDVVNSTASRGVGLEQSGGAHSMFDLTAQRPSDAEGSVRSRALSGSPAPLNPGASISVFNGDSGVTVPAPGPPGSTEDLPQPTSISPQLSSGAMSQPEQELPPQAPASDVLNEPLTDPEDLPYSPSPADIPVPSGDEGLDEPTLDADLEQTLTDDQVLLSCTPIDAEIPEDPLLDIRNFVPACGETTDSQALLAEDDLPWIEDPLETPEGYAYCLEIPLKEKDIRAWLQERSPEQMVHVASAGRKARVEVSLKELSPAELALFREAKQKELNCWLQTSAIRRILRRRLNPEQILKSRWVLSWKPPDPNSGNVKKAKARLVVLGYQDPMLTEVARDSPTLTREGRSVILQTIASMQWRLRSFDITTAFLRGKADANNPLAMEPPRELRELMRLQDDEVCELLGNAYGRVDAPLLFYRELSSQLKKLGFRQHPLDPCIFLLETGSGRDRVLHGLLGVHVDDGLGGGDSLFDSKLKALQKVLPFGSEKFDKLVFTGIYLDQQPDFSIRASQKNYVEQILPVEVHRSRRQTPDAPLNPDEVTNLRGIVGSLQYAVTHTRPDLAAKLSEVQTQVAQPTIKTLLQANKVLREAQEFSDTTITYLSIKSGEITFVSFGDASFASQRNLSSHQGTLIGATTSQLDANVEAPMSPLVWASKKIARVVKSTLSAEAYAMSRSVDLLGWIRALWGCIHVPDFPWEDPLKSCHLLKKALVVTDCRSLYDLVTRTAMPSCAEFRTTLEVLLIKQRCEEHIRFRWVPTTLMLADGLTKAMSVDLLREILRICRFKLHDEACELPKEAHRREVLTWLRQMDSDKEYRRV